jgi:hypothetical protein
MGFIYFFLRKQEKRGGLEKIRDKNRRIYKTHLVLLLTI